MSVCGPSASRQLRSRSRSRLDSAGEKQLLALARSMVKGSRLIALDEASSSLDPESDAILQRTIRTHFTNCTILCIAHRLSTIAFYDKVLVMDAGLVKEFGSPLELFDREVRGEELDLEVGKGKSVFRGMCEAAGLDREGIEKIRGERYLGDVTRVLV